MKSYEKIVIYWFQNIARIIVSLHQYDKTILKNNFNHQSVDTSMYIESQQKKIVLRFHLAVSVLADCVNVRI